MREWRDLCEFGVNYALKVKAKNLAVLFENFFDSDFVRLQLVENCDAPLPSLLSSTLPLT